MIPFQLSERFWKNLSTTIGWLSIGMLFTLITFSSSLEIKDLDLWLHLRMGWWISHYGFIPHYDVLSCSILGKSWVNHEWLFQVLVYQVQQNYGFDGLISMQSFVVGTTFLLLLFLGYSRDRQWLTIFGLLMVLMVYQTRFTIRPDIFSLLFFVLEIYFLSMHISQRWVCYVLVILQILWTNMHGFFFFGPCLAGIGVLSELIKRRLPLPYEWNTVGRLTDEEYGRLKKILPLMLLACCVNPLTFQGAWYPVSVFFHLTGDNKIFFNHIVELQRPISWGNVFSYSFIWYKALILFSAMSIFFNRKKIDISSLLIWAIFLGFSLVAIRNLVYFAVAAYMVLMVNAISIAADSILPLRFTADKFKYITGIIFKAWIMFWMLQTALHMTNNKYFDFDTYRPKSEFYGVSKRSYPYKAVDFLVREKVQGNFFNDFNSGAYLVGRTSPGIKVFIDGRTEEYGSAFFKMYQKIWNEGNAKVFEDCARRYNITGALLNNTRQEIPRPVLKMFHGMKNWAIVYLDHDAAIFLKQTALNKPLIDKFSVDLPHWKPKPMDLFTLGTLRIDPFPFASRAYILEVLDADEGAILESKEALRVAPDYGPAFNILARISNKKKDYLKAFEYYRLATQWAEDAPSRLGFAQAYEHLGHYNEAISQYQRVLDAAHNNAQAFFGMARSYAQEGQTQKALEIINQARKLGLEDKVDVQKIHDIINSKKKKMDDPKKRSSDKKGK